MARKELADRLRGVVAGASEARSAATLATRIEQAKLVAQTIGRLKGAVMKVGQLVSLEGGDVLPPEVLAVLSSLQQEAEPVDFAAMLDVLTSELGAERVARLEGLGEPAAASASIGQVYRARVDGADVAVKVQYPGVAESIDSDLDVLAKLGQGLVALAGREVDLSEVVRELRHVLHLEADYERERSYLERFAALTAGEPRFLVPRAYPELSTRRVLTMSWEEGVPLGRWLTADHPRAVREALARAMLDVFCLELFSWGVVQTDPNFGNFLVREGPGGEVALVLLDFGAALDFDTDFRRAYVRVLAAIGSGDRARIVDEGLAFGLLDPREAEEPRALFADLMIASFEPFEPSRQPFVFHDPAYAARTRDLGMRFVRSLRYSPPPKHLLFLNRRLGGLFQLLRRLEVTLDLRPYAARMLGAP